MGSEEFESETVGLPIGFTRVADSWGDKADEQKDEADVLVYGTRGSNLQ